jgi:hypothetical protein
MLIHVYLIEVKEVAEFRYGQVYEKKGALGAPLEFLTQSVFLWVHIPCIDKAEIP